VKRVVLSLMVVLTANGSSQISPAKKVQILFPTKGNGRDCQLIPSPEMGPSKWLGLFRDGDGYDWRETQVTMRWRQADADEHKGKWHGVQVKAEAPMKPLLMVQGLPELEKVIPEAAGYPAHEAQWLTSKPLVILFGGQRYWLEMVSIGPYKKTRLELVLRAGKERQVLDRIVPTDAGGYSLEWAGDLDGDGKLDLLFTASEISENAILMLSSHAKARELVGRVATRVFDCGVE
jgi:hypothetical protein